jgi:hypothetical protein
MVGHLSICWLPWPKGCSIRATPTRLSSEPSPHIWGKKRKKKQLQPTYPHQMRAPHFLPSDSQLWEPLFRPLILRGANGRPSRACTEVSCADGGRRRFSRRQRMGSATVFSAAADVGRWRSSQRPQIPPAETSTVPWLARMSRIRQTAPYLSSHIVRVEEQKEPLQPSSHLTPNGWESHLPPLDPHL